MNVSDDVFYMQEYPPIRRSGKLLRYAKTDEFPQVINIPKGDKFIVSLRTPLPREMARDTAVICDAGAGLLLADCPHRCRWRLGELVALDIPHINREPFGRSWKIVLRTFSAVLRFEGESLTNINGVMYLERCFFGQIPLLMFLMQSLMLNERFKLETNILDVV